MIVWFFIFFSNLIINVRILYHLSPSQKKIQLWEYQDFYFSAYHWFYQFSHKIESSQLQEYEYAHIFVIYIIFLRIFLIEIFVLIICDSLFRKKMTTFIIYTLHGVYCSLYSIYTLSHKWVAWCHHIFDQLASFWNDTSSLVKKLLRATL